MASCGDLRPFSCVIFALGAVGADFEKTPNEQFLPRDYHPLVQSQTNFNVLDRQTGVRASASR